MKIKYTLFCLVTLLVGCVHKTPVSVQNTPVGFEKGKGVYIAVDKDTFLSDVTSAPSIVTKTIAPYSSKVRNSSEKEDLFHALIHAKESAVDYVYLLNVKKWKKGNPSEVDLGLSVYNAYTGELLLEDRFTRVCGGKKAPSECLQPRLAVWAGDVYR